MAREHANIRLAMWGDSAWRSLSVQAQHLYMLILTHPSLTRAGVADWRPGRLASLTQGNTRSGVEEAAAELQAGAFVWVDEESEEIFVRSFVKWDGLLKQNKVAITMANDYAAIASPRIRAYFAFELAKLHREQPDLMGFKFDRVKQILREPARDMKDDISHSQGQGLGQALPLALDHGLAQALAQSQGLRTATTTATATFPSNEGKGGAGGKGLSEAHTAFDTHPEINPNEIDPFATDPEPITPEPIRPEPDMFTQFWNAYPRKAGRVAALKAWTLAVQQGTPETTILAGAARYAADPNRVAQFTKNPANWLSAGDWDADPLPARLTTNGTAAEKRNAEWAAAYAELQNEPTEYLEFPETQEGIK